MRFTQPVSTLRRVPRQVAGEGSTRVCGAQAVTAAAAADCRELTGHQAQARELHLQTQPLSRRCGLSTPQPGDAQCRPPHTFPPVCGRPGRRPAVGEVASSAVGSSPASPRGGRDPGGQDNEAQSRSAPAGPELGELQPTLGPRARWCFLLQVMGVWA